MKSEEFHVTSEIFMITVIFLETIPQPEFSLSASQESGSEDCCIYVPQIKSHINDCFSRITLGEKT